MQCIAWDQALLWEKNCKNWRYKAQKSASEVSWVADWGRKRLMPPFPLSSITNFFISFSPTVELGSGLLYVLLGSWSRRTPLGNNTAFITAIYWLQLLFYWYNNNNSHSVVEASSTLIFGSPVVPWVSCCHNGINLNSYVKIILSRHGQWFHISVHSCSDDV